MPSRWATSSIWVDVSTAVVQGAAKLVVEGVDVAVAEAAGIRNLIAKVDGLKGFKTPVQHGGQSGHAPRLRS